MRIIGDVKENKLFEIIKKYEEELKEQQATLENNKKSFAEFELSAEKWDYKRQLQYSVAIGDNERSITFLKRIILDFKTLK